MPENGPTGADRRTILKRAGVAGVAVWSAPVVTSLTSPALAATGSPAPGTIPGCVVLERAARVSVQVVAYSACNALSFGLQAPSTVKVCGPCSTADSASLGSFDAGTELAFYLDDPATCCGCPQRYLCTDARNVRVTRESETSFLMEFRDNGCACGTSSISEGVNLAARVTLT